uniref:Purkinje cell protein 4 n=1 Tax=Electrophorus electricus TaxID=8005 RepID=A0A4W4EUN7_ELEEL
SIGKHSGGAGSLLSLAVGLEGDASKKSAPEDFDIDMDAPETEKAAVAIQSQFRKFQKKKHDDKA